jgi:heme oxygenase
MQTLKEGTRDLHDNAEGQDFQRWLASGDLPQSLYVQYLEQLLLIHSSLEQSLLEARVKDRRIGEVLAENQLQVPFLEQDIEFLADKAAKPLPTKATRWMLERIDELSNRLPLALLGMHYVLLGSKHGGKFIAHNLHAKLQLDDGKGVLYFNPYGANFQQIWKDFSSAFNALELTADEETVVLEAARKMFEGMGRLSGDMTEIGVAS